MRLFWLNLSLTVLTIGQADASSFVHVAPPSVGDAPSIVTLGVPAPKPTDSAAPKLAAASPPLAPPDPAADGLVPLAYALPDMRPASDIRPISISPSIIAFEIPEPPVTFEKVAAIGAKPQPQPPSPMMIRGGTVGDGVARIVVPATLQQAAKSTERKAGRKSDATDAAGHWRPVARPEQLQAPPLPTPVPTGPTSAPR